MKAATPANTTAPVPRGDSQMIALGAHHLAVFANDDLAAPQTDHHHAIIIIHGRKGDAGGSLALMQGIVRRARKNSLIIAPQFIAAPPHAALRWPDAGWMAGEPAIGASLGSFAALDGILASLSMRARFASLKQITIAGHSAGAQLVQRYAAMADVQPVHPRLRFIIATPSSYLYFDNRRAMPGGFATPSEALYPGFDDWKYGLQNRPAFVADTPPAVLASRYAGRDIVYLLGALDNNPADPGLDMRAAAQAQGRDRLERGQNYWRYLHESFGPALNQRMVIIPDVGHDQTAMFQNEASIEAIFSPA